MTDQAALRSLVFDSLEDQIAIIDETGTIIDVNSSWTSFGLENGLAADYSCVGRNYLEAAAAASGRGDSLAEDAVRALRTLLSGEQASLYFEYPCHSPDKKRWFMMCVSRVKGGRTLFAVTHRDITKRKLAEEALEFLAFHDPLTSLSNRRHFNEALNKEWRRSTRDPAPISLIVLDLDYYKEYNDALGHLAGDQGLVEVSRTLQGFCRRSADLAIRFGGDELGLLLGQTALPEAHSIAEQIRTAIYDLDLAFGEARRLTISAGVASAVPQRNETEHVLVSEADRALYAAKRDGRNRVVCAQGGADPV